MKLITAGITWLARGAMAIVGGLVLLTAAIALVVGLATQSPQKGIETGARASYAVVHYGFVSLGVVSSFGDDVGPSLKTGQDLGNAQTKNSGV